MFREKPCILRILCVTMLTGLLMTGCGSSKAGADLELLQEKMPAAELSLPEMTTVNDRSDEAEELFSYLSDISYSKIEGYFLSYSSEGLADEIALVRVKNSGDVSDVEASLQEHVQNRVDLFASYNADQVDRAENALVFTSGRDVVLIISDHQELVRKAYFEASDTED